MKTTRFCTCSGQCAKDECDMSCSKNTMLQLHLEKSNIDNVSPAFSICSENMEKFWDIISSTNGTYRIIQCKKASKCAEYMTYCAICKLGYNRGSSISVYHLDYNSYVQMIKDSWSGGVTMKLREIQAFVSSAAVLIVSGIDYCVFNDFECQTLMQILDERQKIGKSTLYLVSDITFLAGKGSFFPSMKQKFKEELMTYD